MEDEIRQVTSGLPPASYRAEASVTGKHYFIEEKTHRASSQYGRKDRSASGLLDTQNQAEAFVKKLNPNDHSD
jgi:hypothetical protein